MDPPSNTTSDPKTNRWVTLADVARVMGLSKATVARALSGVGSVSPKTKNRVIAEAKKLGYRSDPVMSALSSYRHRKGIIRRWQPLALLMPDIDRKSHEAFPYMDNHSLFKFAQKRAEDLGYHLDLFFGKGGIGLAALSRQIYARGYLGLLIETIRQDFAQDFSVDNFPTVVIDWNSHHQVLHHITVDWQQMTIMAAQKALDLGYRKLGFVHLNTEVDVSRTGYIWWEREKITAKCGPQPQPFVWENRFLHDVNYKDYLPQMEEWLKKEKPDVVISDNITVYWMLQLLKIRIPTDIGYIGIGTALNPREKIVARVEHSFEEQGSRAIELLDKLIRIGERGYPQRPYKVLTAGLWVNGQTVRKSTLK